ncbi:MAG: SMI1/KNR4 family protein [Polyangiaceae bacterium]
MSDLSQLVERLRNVQTEVLRLAPFRDIGLVPNPSASPQAIAAAEERLGLPLPPSYRAFLAKHDGWPRCFDGASLLGTACLGNRTYAEFAQAAFAAAETPEPRLGPPARRQQFTSIIPFGVDMQSMTLFAFNPSVKSADGEYEVIAWINELGMRRDDFPSFLELLIELADYELDGHRAHAEPALQRVG